MTCPHCYSPNITLVQYEKETGYRDKGEVFECRDCSRVSTPEEVEAEDIRSFEQAMTAGCILARSAEIIGLQLATRMHEAAGLDLKESFAACREEARQGGRLEWVN